jgi:hypothetical protein
MNVWNSLRRLFGAGTTLRKLRNRPQGMAWIRMAEDGSGAGAMHNRAVKTVEADAEGFWRVEPPQQFVAHALIIDRRRNVCWPGMVVTVGTINDACLEPWKDDGVTDREVRELYAPIKECPQPDILALPVREMTR